MSTDTNIFCTAPWVGITVRENGDVKTCCVGGTVLGNLNHHSIDDILHDQPLKKIQKVMALGQPDQENCKTCIQELHTSNVALQQHYKKFYPDFTKDEVKLKFLDIRWNNICNLGCVYCNSTFSSTWEDRLKIKRSSVVKPYQNQLLKWVLDRSTEINELMLVGGEPMLMKQNHELIKDLTDQCKISIITNLSYKLTELPCLPKLLSRPRSNTNWNVSLENIGDKFEYVRNGSTWTLIEDNLHYLVEHWPNSISINFVYSMLSAFDVVDTIKLFHKFGIKKINLMPIHTDESMNVFNMPAGVRKKAAQQLILAQHWHFENLHPEDKDFYPLQGIDVLINKLIESQEPASITLEMFYNKVIQYDKYNQKKFKDLWPDVIDLVEKNL